MSHQSAAQHYSTPECRGGNSLTISLIVLSQIWAVLRTEGETYRAKTKHHLDFAPSHLKTNDKLSCWSPSTHPNTLNIAQDKMSKL